MSPAEGQRNRVTVTTKTCESYKPRATRWESVVHVQAAKHN